MPSLTVSRAADGVESAATASGTADHRQAEYFLRLLAQSRRHIDHRICEYQKAIALAEAGGDSEGASGLRRMARIEEQDRQTLDRLIDKLHRRFSLRAPGEVPPIPRRVFVVR